MPDPETFEARLEVAYRRYANEVTTSVDALALARTIALRPGRGRRVWPRRGALGLAVVLALLLALAIAAALVVGSRPAPPVLPTGPGNGWIAYATQPGHLFVRHTPGPSSEIYLVEPGAAPHLVVGGGALNVCPDFSPDGTRLAYGERIGETRVVVILTIDGAGSAVGPALRLPVEHTTDDPCPAWSPDGTRVAVRDGDAIRIIALDGASTIIPDWDAGPPLTYWEGAFDWSPDGATLAVARPSGTWLVAVNGDPPQLLRSNPSRSANWSPDGTWIAVTEEDPSFDLRAHPKGRLVSLAGPAEPIDLDPDGTGAGTAQWSPDGGRIAYTSETGVMVASRDGTDARLVDGPGSSAVAWSPDGRYVLSMVKGNGSWGLTSTAVEDPHATTTVVSGVPAADDLSWPGPGDVSWQAVR
jgi:dipeptidyl aminopeptidase/acylaminoacyl peptidase